MKYDVLLTIGHNVNGKPTLTTRYITKRVTMRLQIQGFTAIPCLGMWEGEAEESTRLEINALDKAKADDIRAQIPELAKALGQMQIMFEMKPSRVEFIDKANDAQAVKSA